MSHCVRVLRLLPVLLVAAGVSRCAPVDGYSYGYAAPAQPVPDGYAYAPYAYDPGYQPYYADPGYAPGGVFFGFGGGGRDWHDHRDPRWASPPPGPGQPPRPPPGAGTFRPPPSAPPRPVPLAGQAMPQHPSFAAPAPPPRLAGAPPVRPKRPGEP